MSDFTLASQLVGSYSKPEWLANHAKAYAADQPWWRISGEHLPAAIDDAVLLAIFDQERSGLDLVTDGEQRRQSFSGYFFGLDGINLRRWSDRPLGPSDLSPYLERPPGGDPQPGGLFRLGPEVSGPISWPGPISLADFNFLKRNTRKRTKVTVIGPTTLAVRIVDKHYGDLAKLTFAIADALNKEVLALQDAGADLIQIDDPEVHFNLSKVKGSATEALDRMIRGVTVPTAVHMCYGYARSRAKKQVNPKYAEAIQVVAASKVDEISLEYEQPGHEPDVLVNAGGKAVILGLLNLHPEAPVEKVDHIISRARAALEVIPAGRLRLAPDCGMWFLSRSVARAKITALSTAARALRNEL